MYERFFGLHELPFELTPNPKFLFLTPRHREALSNLQYGVSSAKSLTVLVGEAGTGKTTLLRSAFESEPCRNVRWIFLSNPVLTREDFIRTLATHFELGGEAAESKATFVHALERLLRERRARGEVTALVVDEAQSLSHELLEEIRLLANIETTTEKLLLLVLAGQPELATRLNDPALRQLKQRVALRCEIAPFDLAETAAYIASRLRTAGGDSAKIFTREAVIAVHQYSRGIPRTVNVICDNALVSGLALGRQPVDKQIVLEVAADFDLLPQGALDPRVASIADAVPAAAESEQPAQPAAEPQRPRKMFEQIASSRRFAFFGAARK